MPLSLAETCVSLSLSLSLSLSFSQRELSLLSHSRLLTFALRTSVRTFAPRRPRPWRPQRQGRGRPRRLSDTNPTKTTRKLQTLQCRFSPPKKKRELDRQTAAPHVDRSHDARGWLSHCLSICRRAHGALAESWSWCPRVSPNPRAILPLPVRVCVCVCVCVCLCL